MHRQECACWQPHWLFFFPTLLLFFAPSATQAETVCICLSLGRLQSHLYHYLVLLSDESSMALVQFLGTCADSRQAMYLGIEHRMAHQVLEAA